MSTKEWTEEELSSPSLPHADRGYVAHNAFIDDDTWGPEQEAHRIAGQHGTDVAKIKSTSREKHVVAARQKLWGVLRDRGWSFASIGLFTGHHHSSVIYALSYRIPGKP
jgi:Bacterial dnaA protein helix-turn-helix